MTVALGARDCRKGVSTLLVDAADQCLGRSTTRLATGTGGNLRIWFQGRLMGRDWRGEYPPEFVAVDQVRALGLVSLSGARFLSIASVRSVLSTRSIGSFLSISSIGSFADVASVMSTVADHSVLSGHTRKEMMGSGCIGV